MKSNLPRSKFAVLVFATLTALVGLAQAQEPNWTNAAYQDAAWEGRGCTNDARGQWFRDAKFGAFIHFGLYSELGGYWQGKGPYDPSEQIMGLGQREQVIPWEQYQKEVGGAFNPTNFNAKEWVSLVKKAGQKYIIVTTKHHDGFAMFHTATTRFNVVDSTPFARDVIKELADECQRQGIVFCPYYSLGDWSAADVMDRKFASYQDYMRTQLQELFQNYGPIKMIWLDNYWYVKDQWQNDLAHAKELYAFIHSISPNTLIDDRVGGGAGSTDGDYTTPENQLEGARQSRYFEVVMSDTVDDNWGWVKNATNYRKPGDLICNLIDCASKGGNFVLNVGPTASGEFPKEHVAILEVIGKWTSINGEAIYGTTPAPECEVEAGGPFVCYSTKNARNVFLHVTNWPKEDGAGVVRIARIGLVGVEMVDGALGKVEYGSAVEDGKTVLKIKKPAQIDPYATVLRLTFRE
jgi:alpha-L-fucosidase